MKISQYYLKTSDISKTIMEKISKETLKELYKSNSTGLCYY